MPCPVWDLNLYGSTGCLRLFKKGRSHFWRKPNDMTTVPFASNTSTWKIERLLVMFGILISPFYIPGYHHQDHHHHSFSGFGHAFFFLWTLLDTSTKSQVTCASTSCCIFSCISVSSYGGDYDDFFSSIWFRWLLLLRVEMGHICMYNISILHVTKNEKTQDTKHESNVSYLPYNMALPNAARNTKYQRLNRLG